MLRIVILLLLTSSLAFATSNEIKLLHEPIKELPTPGRGMMLALHISGSRSPNHKVRALVVRDGKLLDVALLPSTFDKGDRLVYAAQVPAPHDSISYQFVLSEESGEQHRTKQFKISRACTPQSELEPYDGKPIDPARESGLHPLVNQARGLVRDVEQYELLSRQLEALKEALNK